jgi:hypothetical protein
MLKEAQRVYKNLSQNARYLGLVSNTAAPVLEVEALTTSSRRTVRSFLIIRKICTAEESHCIV